MLTPAPGPTPSDEQALDDILNNIDRLVEHQCQKATKHRGGDPETPAPPTQAFSAARFKKTQMAFQALSESKLELADSREDNTPLASEKPAPEPPKAKSIWPWRKAALG